MHFLNMKFDCNTATPKSGGVVRSQPDSNTQDMSQSLSLKVGGGKDFAYKTVKATKGVLQAFHGTFNDHGDFTPVEVYNIKTKKWVAYGEHE